MFLVLQMLLTAKPVPTDSIWHVKWSNAHFISSFRFITVADLFRIW